MKSSGIVFRPINNKFDVEIAEILVNSSNDLIELLKEKDLIQPSPILVVPFFELLSNFNQINRCLSTNGEGDFMAEIFKESKQNKSLPDFDAKNFQTITEWFAWIVKNQKIDALLKQWKYLKETNPAIFSSLQSLLILFGFLPFVSEDEEIFNILLDIIRLSCNEANASLIISFHLCHYSIYPTNIKRKLLQNLSKMKFNDFLTKQIL